MRQKQIIGSHFANAWECNLGQRAHRGEQDPAGAVAYDGLRPGRGGPPAHAREQAPRARSPSSSAPPRRARARRPRARARSARRWAPDGRRRPHPLVRDGLPPRQARGRARRHRAGRRCATARAPTAVHRIRDDRYKFLQIGRVRDQGATSIATGTARSSSTSACCARAGTRCRCSTAGPTSSSTARSSPRSRSAGQRRRGRRSRAPLGDPRRCARASARCPSAGGPATGG